MTAFSIVNQAISQRQINLTNVTWDLIMNGYIVKRNDQIELDMAIALQDNFETDSEMRRRFI